MDKNNIEKIVSETFNNPDVMSFIVNQVKSQIEKEQSKVEKENLDKKDSIKNILDSFEKRHLKNVKLPQDINSVIHDMDKKVNTYLNDNNFLKDYVDNRDVFMNMFSKSIEDTKNEEEPCEKCSNHCEHNCDYDFGTNSCSHCDTNEDNISNGTYTYFKTGLKHDVDEKGNPVGYIYFNLDSNGQIDIEKQLVDYYSLIAINSDTWTNWEQYHDEYHHEEISEDGCLYSFIDEYSCVFDEERDYDEIPDKDKVTSFIYTKFDNEVKSLTIYMLNFSRGTNILYDFKREIITLPQKATQKDYDEFYFNLSKYISDSENLVTIPDVTGGKNYQCYDYVNQYKVNNHPITDREDLAQNYLKKDIIDTIKEFDNKSYFDAKKISDDEKAQRKNKMDCIDFFRNAINDGFIKVEIFSPEHIYLNINGTKVFFNNPYACNPRKDILGNDEN